MDYVYAGTRAKALHHELLTDTQRELLLGSKSVDEFFTNLHDTFLGSYIAEDKERGLSLILEDTISDAKKLLDTIAPERRVLEGLWLKYDFYNLKAIIKGKRVGLDRDQIKEHCFFVGLYSPEVLLQAHEDNRLAFVDERLLNAAEEADTHESPAAIDRVLNVHYLRALRSLAEKSKNKFLQEYTTLLIDIYNLRAALRTKVRGGEMNVADTFIDSGTFHRDQLESSDAVLALFSRHFGGAERWKEAIEQYQQNGNFVLLEKASEDYVADWLKNKSRDIFSAAPLFSYFTAKKNNAQAIRAIHVGKVSGLEESEIRKTLRNPYATL